MKKDNGKITVDLKLKNSENITDIDDMTAEYVQDEEFEKFIRDGLDDSWEDLGLSVSDDLIARTMQAIKEHASEGSADTAAKAVTKAAEPEAQESAGRTKVISFRRYSRIAAGIAAAVLVGIVGIGIASRGSFLSKSAKGDSAAPAYIANNMTADTAAYSSEAADYDEADENDFDNTPMVSADSLLTEDAFAQEKMAVDAGSATAGNMIQSIGEGTAKATDTVMEMDDRSEESSYSGYDGEYARALYDEMLNNAGDVFCDTVRDENTWNEITEYIRSVEIVQEDSVTEYYPEDNAEYDESEVRYVIETVYENYFLRYYVFPDKVFFSRITNDGDMEPEFYGEEYQIADGDEVAAGIQSIIAQHSGE